MNVARLEQVLGYRFVDPSLLQTALTHRSHSAPHNERLEFVGDSVLNCAIALDLFRRFPGLPEGDLSRLRANLVCQDTLHRIAQALELGAHLRLGEGELRSGGHCRPSILADALEALIGAVHLDGGFPVAAELVGRLYANQLSGIVPGQQAKDPKTRLQEYLQGRRMALPKYVMLDATGLPHAQNFRVCCEVPALRLRTEGSGQSRRAAEQMAAEKALESIK